MDSDERDKIRDYIHGRLVHTHIIHKMLGEGYLDAETLALFAKSKELFTYMVVPFYPDGFGNNG